jgi:ribonuclease HII
MPRALARRTTENAYRRFGFNLVAGVDEVGRGCLAGPVLAGAVVLNPARHIPGLADSKLLSAVARDRLYDLICRHAQAWAIGVADPAEIDRYNIHRASLRAMARAVGLLTPQPDLVLVDAFRIDGLLMAQHAIVGGDRRCAAIAAASIVAKVTRDRMMDALHQSDERYGFDRHKGYATSQHLAAVAAFGYSGAHRRSFRPASLLDSLD